MGEVGKNLIKGLWNGISNVTGWIVSKIKGFGKSVLGAIKGIFGVHSPSTEFEWIGKMNMVGLEQGMESMKSKLQGTIDTMFNLQPNVSGSMQSTYSPQMTVNVQNNMELDPLGQLVNNIKTFSGGAKNDYNWGASL
jgi:phage-related protein